MTDKNVCPVCRSKKNLLVDVCGSAEYISLIYVNHGGARLRACLDCGVMYIDQFDRESILSRELMKEKRKKKG